MYRPSFHSRLNLGRYPARPSHSTLPDPLENGPGEARAQIQGQRAQRRSEGQNGEEADGEGDDHDVDRVALALDRRAEGGPPDNCSNEYLDHDLDAQLGNEAKESDPEEEVIQE